MRKLLDKALKETRNKIVLERLLKGVAIVLAFILIGLPVATYLMAQNNFSDTAIFWSRIVLGAGFVLFLWRFLIRPLFLAPSKVRVARFLEERNPELQDRLSTAVEIGSMSSDIHPAIRKLIERDAFDKLKEVSKPRFFWPRVSLASLVTGVVTSALLLTLYFGGPAEFHFGIGKLLGTWLDKTDQHLYHIIVVPGNTTVGERADVEIRAQLNGFESESVGLNVRYANQVQWEETRMVGQPDSGDFSFQLYDIRDPVDYFVEAEGIRSDTFRIEVSEIPRVIGFKVVLDFPDYTGISDSVLEDETFISALKGTQVRLEMESDQPSPMGLIKFENREDLEFSSEGGTSFVASFEVSDDDYFRIHLANSEGVLNPASDEFIIEALDDQSPVVSFSYPGRDRRVTNIEEVFTEVRAEDDHGLGSLKIHYSVNGGATEDITLSLNRGAKQVTTSHTFYLEEFDLIPGDFVSYWAEGRDAVSSATTDIFFFEVEPFDREYYQAQSAPSGGGAMQQGLELSRQQKQIVVATFSLIQEEDAYTSEEFTENSQTLALVQQRLAAQAQTIIDRIERRGAAASDPRFGEMVEYMKQAVEHMSPAELALNQAKLDEALPEAQKALQQLLRAEALFNEMQVSMSQNSGQGSASPEELADLVDLELDRTKNQYETLQQNQQAQQDRALDDAVEKLKELARRQEQQLERQMKGTQSGSSGGQASQQQMIDQIEELARQLARLSRQKQEQQLDQISRELNRAARDMRRAASSGQSEQQSQQMAQRALERMKRAQEALTQQRESQVQEEFSQLKQRAERIVEEQDRIMGEMSEMGDPQPGEQGISEDYLRKLRSLFWEKQDLQRDLQGLETDLHQSARRLEGEEPEAAEKLKEAGHAIRDNRLPEKMQESTDRMANGLMNMALRREEEVGQELQSLMNRIEDAERSLGAPGRETPEEKLRQALNEAGRLAEKLESFKRAVEQGQRGEEGSQPPGQEGQMPNPSGETSENRSEQASAQASQEQGSQPGRQFGQQSGSQSGESSSEQSSSQSASGSGGQTEQAGSPGSYANSGINPSQVGREWKERVREASELRRLLESNPKLAREAANLARQMQQLDVQRVFDDVEELARLKAQVIDGLHQLELEINQTLQEENESYLRPVNEDQIPPEFRERVEDYYRRLSANASKQDGE